MNKIKLIPCLMMMLLLISCSKEKYHTEWINVVNSTDRPVKDAYQIKDPEIINSVNEVIRGLIWQDKQIETSGNSDYSFWLQRSNTEMRITNYEIWFNDGDSSAVIVDYFQAKYAPINRIPLEQLIQLFELGKEKAN
ncbi:hypothetical protein ACFP56_11895 [Paenibacillus septentrionalis]|uniref:Lipoprotein n=1 Tax=Paenibacillus septentrionalis TaxID=429342 RepID=A0ABW1V548_9BACL